LHQVAVSCRFHGSSARSEECQSHRMQAAGVYGSCTSSDECLAPQDVSYRDGGKLRKQVMDVRGCDFSFLPYRWSTSRGAARSSTRTQWRWTAGASRCASQPCFASHALLFNMHACDQPHACRRPLPRVSSVGLS
jgi:hypothetical protein